MTVPTSSSDSECRKLALENQQLMEEIHRLSTTLNPPNQLTTIYKQPSSLISVQSRSSSLTFPHGPTKSLGPVHSAGDHLKSVHHRPPSCKPMPPCEGAAIRKPGAAKLSNQQNTSVATGNRPPPPPQPNNKPRDKQGHVPTLALSSASREAQLSRERALMQERLVGEIAFQLDKRILHSVFSHRKRLYGFSVRNISDKIDECTRDPRTGKVDIERREALRAKRDSAMLFLARAAGYNPRQHGIFAEKLVNRYGVLRISSKSKSEPGGGEYSRMMREEFLKSAIMATVEADSTYDALTLLNSLLAFAKLDGKSLFLW